MRNWTIIYCRLWKCIYMIMCTTYSIKGMSNFFPFPQSYQPGYSSREDHDLLVSYQTEQRLSVSVHRFLSQLRVADLSIYVYTNLFSSATSENFLLYISLDLSYHDHNIQPAALGRLLICSLYYKSSRALSRNSENRLPLLPILHGPLHKSKGCYALYLQLWFLHFENLNIMHLVIYN